MRYRFGALLLLATTGCPTSGTVAPSDASLGEDSTLGLIPETDGGTAYQPSEAGTCTDPSRCIFGTAILDPSWSTECPSTQCTTWQVDLFATYPSGSVRRIGNPQLIAMDSSWKFDQVGVDAGQASEYYVQATAAFAIDGGGSSLVSAVVGPISLPAPAQFIDVRPVQAVSYESRGPGGASGLDWVLARVFDPLSGAPITSGAAVTVTVGDAAVPLSPTAFGSETDYYTAFANPPPSQPTYAVTAQTPAFVDAGIDGGVFAVELVADPPAFNGAITDAAVGPGETITVSWTSEPQSGFEVVQVFAAQGDGGWSANPVYMSPLPDPPSQTTETTTPLEAGTYLVNVAYTNANCPSDAGGCVQSSMVAAATATLR